MPRRSPARALRDALEPCHAVQHHAPRFRKTFRDIAPMGTWRGVFRERPAPLGGVPAFGVIVAVHDRDPLQPVGARIVHESGLPLPLASQTTGS